MNCNHLYLRVAERHVCSLYKTPAEESALEAFSVQQKPDKHLGSRDKIWYNSLTKFCPADPSSCQAPFALKMLAVFVLSSTSSQQSAMLAYCLQGNAAAFLQAHQPGL